MSWKKFAAIIAAFVVLNTSLAVFATTQYQKRYGGFAIALPFTVTPWAAGQAATTTRFTGSVLPQVDGLYDNGSSTLRWRNMYISSQLCLSGDCKSAWPTGGGGGSAEGWSDDGTFVSLTTSSRKVLVPSQLTANNISVTSTGISFAASGTIAIAGTATSTFAGDVSSTHFLAMDGTQGGTQSFGFTAEPTLGMHRHALGVLDIGAASQIRIDINNGATLFAFGASSLLPTPTNNNDLGSGSASWKDFYASGTSRLGGQIINTSTNTSTFMGAVSGTRFIAEANGEAAAAFSFSGHDGEGMHLVTDTTVDINADAQIRLDIGNSAGLAVLQSTTFFPSPNNSISLGTGANSWSNIFASGTAYIGTDVRVGGSSVCLSNGTNCPFATSGNVSGATSTVVAITPGAFASSTYGERTVEIYLTTSTGANLALTGASNTSTCFVVTTPLNGMRLVEVHLQHSQAGTGTGSSTVQVRNQTRGVNMLTTAVSIDVGELGSDTASALPVISVANASVSTYDRICADVSAVESTIAGTETILSMTFQHP